MNSGVYWLEFADGVDYVGKAQDIEARWKQHSRAFEKGTAAKNMQAAYNRYGFPKGHVLEYCHSDHIDIAEAYYILKHRPSLNTAIPREALSDQGYEVLKTANFLETSTLDHCKTIISRTEIANERGEIIDALNNEIEHLSKIRSTEEITTDAYMRAQAEKKQYIAKAELELSETRRAYEKRINKLLNRSLWKRIINAQ